MKRVSEYLKEAREKKGVSLEEAADETKIKSSYLRAIEDGRFSSLPSRSYVVGFIKTYAQYLGLSQEKVFAFLRREYGEEKLEVVPTYRKKQPHIKRSLYRRPGVLLGIIAVIAIAGYILFQYLPLLFGPKLEVTSPKQNQRITNNVVIVSGKTDPYATISVEGEDVYVDLTGSFKKSLYVFSGDKKITVVAKNRFGKDTTKEVTVKVE
jgi:cytoskeletal protein RodZ